MNIHAHAGDLATVSRRLQSFTQNIENFVLTPEEEERRLCSGCKRAADLVLAS